MASTRTATYGNRTMFEPYRELQNSLCEVSKWVGRTDRILSVSAGPAPAAYLSASRAIRGLQEAWSLHLRIERGLFRRLLQCKLLSAEFLVQFSRRNHAIESLLNAVISAPWPRSPQAGVESLRSGMRKILNQLLTQIELEQALILPAIPALDRQLPIAVSAEIETSELAAI